MFHKIKDVYPLPNMKLSVLFTDGTTKKYDVAPLAMRIPTFKALENDSLFNDVQVDVGGYGIIWNDYIDLSCDELWYNGVTESTPFGRPYVIR